jgi:hypothetical protein
MLTPLIRGLVPLAPLAVVDGLQMGVGKNLLADLLSILAHGKPAQPLPYSREDEENKKVITASFRAGHDLFVFDEAHVIEGRNLARSITSITYSDRILGVSNMIEFPNKVTWVALGNNVSVNGDLSRRVYRIRLAPTTANPQDRDVSSYRHPDIKRWTVEHRAELIGACLTLVRAWFTGDREENASGRRFGSFEQWGGMIGGILDNAGVTGFLGSLVEWRSETDFEGKWWTDHLAWLRRQFIDEEFAIKDVVAAMRKAPTGSVEHPPRLEDHTVTGYNRTLGLAYAKVKNRVMNGLQLVRTAETAGHGARWRVVPHASWVDEVTNEVMVRVSHPSDAEMSEKAQSNGHVAESAETLENSGSQGSKGRSAPPPRKNFPITTHTLYVDEKSEGTAPRYYPTYPNYPSTDGADPLAVLLPLASPAPVRVCPDCDGVEELTPDGFTFGCPSCHEAMFAPR